MTAFFKEIELFRGNGNENEKGQTLEEFLEEYDPYKYKNPCVTTDAVIFSCKRKVVDGEWKVLMVKRRNHPSIGWRALPGGFIELHENLEDTARRELTEETGVADLPMEQFAVYGNVTRDPRARIITSAYLSVVDEGQVKVQAGDDAADARWMQLHCQTESVKEDGDWKRTIYRLALENKEADLGLITNPHFFKKVQTIPLFEEQLVFVCHKSASYQDGILPSQLNSTDAALIVQAWKLVESRLI